MQSRIRAPHGHILLQTLIVMPILYVLIFLPFSFALIQHKRSVLNDVLEVALQRASVEGGLTEQVRGKILSEMEKRGINPGEVLIQPEHTIVRTRGEIIEISISIPGGAGLLKGLAALGGQPLPDDWCLTAAGSVMSERLH
jgi:hypothetical protein